MASLRYEKSAFMQATAWLAHRAWARPHRACRARCGLQRGLARFENRRTHTLTREQRHGVRNIGEQGGEDRFTTIAELDVHDTG